MSATLNIPLLEGILPQSVELEKRPLLVKIIHFIQSQQQGHDLACRMKDLCDQLNINSTYILEMILSQGKKFFYGDDISLFPEAIILFPEAIIRVPIFSGQEGFIHKLDGGTLLRLRSEQEGWLVSLGTGEENGR
jgi:hypothetical protein